MGNEIKENSISWKEKILKILRYENINNVIKKEITEENKIRRFKSGGVRDLDIDKLDFEGFLSPLVIEEFGKYMHKHRKLSTGEERDSDNWQLGFGDKHFSVCMKSLWRHFFDLWKEHRGYKSREGIQDALNGILFNTMAYYHKFILQKK